MFVEIFEWDGKELRLNKPQVLLMPEFKAIWEADFNKTKSDPENEHHEVAMQVFAFVWLYADYRSDLQEMDEVNKIETALADSGLDPKIARGEMVKAVVIRYDKLQETRILRSLQVANRTLDKLLVYLDGLDIDERDQETGRPMHKAGDIMRNIADIGKTTAGIEELEYMTKKQVESKGALRGEDTEAGIFD
jgi:hypothetical protein